MLHSKPFISSYQHINISYGHKTCIEDTKSLNNKHKRIKVLDSSVTSYDMERIVLHNCNNAIISPNKGNVHGTISWRSTWTPSKKFGYFWVIYLHEHSLKSIGLRVLPFFSMEEATKWLGELTDDSITSSEKLTKAFLERLFPSLKMVKLRDNNKNFKRVENEPLHEIWLQFWKFLLNVRYKVF